MDKISSQIDKLFLPYLLPHGPHFRVGIDVVAYREPSFDTGHEWLKIF